MKILVTGSAGFIGSNLVNKLIEDGHTVFGIDDMSGGKLENIHNNCIHTRLDLRKKAEARRLIERISPEVIYHLAANAAENKSQFSPCDITERNVNTMLNVLTPAIRSGSLKRFVFTSSIAVYGALQTPFKESDDPKPEDIYGVSKLACERIIEILSRVHGFSYVIVRPHNVYGPRQNMADPYRNVVAIFMNKLLKNQPYYIYGDGNQKRCFTYIDDVVHALCHCLITKMPNMTYNVGSDTVYTVNELSEIIQRVSGIVIPPIYEEARNEVHTAVSDHTLAKEYLKYQDRISLEEGIRRTWEYAKLLGPQEPIYDELEIDSPKVPGAWKNKKI